jgi:hypothetical protein
LSAASSGEDHVNGGATLSPWQVNCAGIGAPLTNAELVIDSTLATGVGMGMWALVVFGAGGCRP